MVQSIKMCHFANYWLTFFLLVSVMFTISGTNSFSPYDTLTLSKIGRPSNCLELQFMGYTSSGIYTIYPRVWYHTLPFEVYCDMKTDGGGWTVFQRRAPAEVHVSFYRPWKDYKHGFGHLMQEFWLGNDYLHLLTTQDEVTLRIDLQVSEGNSTYATYSHFKIGHEKTSYNIEVADFTGETSEVPGDSFGDLNSHAFVTFDKNDIYNCSKVFKGGWWYRKCHSSNLNGLYLNGAHDSYADGIEWWEWTGHHYSLEWTEMKIRPRE